MEELLTKGNQSLIGRTRRQRDPVAKDVRRAPEISDDTFSKQTRGALVSSARWVEEGGTKNASVVVVVATTCKFDILIGRRLFGSRT